VSGETLLTIIGNCVADPKLDFTPSGVAVVNWTVASTARKFDKATDSWVDSETLFMPCSIWRDAAENVAESLRQGSRVIVTGRLKPRTYETKLGEKRTVIELEAEEVAASLKYATVKIQKAQRGAGNGGFGGAASGASRSTATPADDPWATAASPQEPPF
jgi:single-strand DNA-binding protein